MCEKTNSSSLMNAMYGGRTAGLFGYSHFAGGFAGGQAEYVRVPFGDNNLLKLPDDVPDEKGTFNLKTPKTFFFYFLFFIFLDEVAYDKLLALGLYLSDVLGTSW